MEITNYEQEMTELIAFMITSARNLLDEPKNYGPLRLLEGVSRLSKILSEGGFENKDFLLDLKDSIDDKKFLIMSDFDSFIDFMDGAVLEVTRFLMRNF